MDSSVFFIEPSQCLGRGIPNYAELMIIIHSLLYAISYGVQKATHILFFATLDTQKHDWQHILLIIEFMHLLEKG